MTENKPSIFAELQKQEIEHCLNRRCFGVDPELARKILEVPNNLSYVREHGLSVKAANKFWRLSMMLQHFHTVQRDIPLAGDRVHLTATGRVDGDTKVYPNAIITNTGKNGVSICVQPYAPFIAMEIPEVFDPVELGGLTMSVSGGYFQNTPWVSLKPRDPLPATYWVFGEGARANGGLYVEVKHAKAWEVVSDLFY